MSRLPAGVNQIIYITHIPWTRSYMYPIKHNDIKRDIYAFDILKIKQTQAINDQTWNQIWINNFDDNSGDAIWQPLSTGVPLNIYTHPLASGHKYNANFSFSPIIPEFVASNDTDDDEDEDTNTRNRLEWSDISPTWDGENTIWFASVFPAFPVLVNSSVDGHMHYGPLFASKITYEASGLGNAQPVKINVNFEGGKLIENENMLIRIGSDYDKTYRTACFTDCAAVSELVINSQDFLKEIAETDMSIIGKEARIVSMSLDIDQRFNYSFPCHKSPYQDKDGARFISLDSRTVTGKLVYYSRDDILNVELPREMTLYFGGPFIFPMPFVDWQKPTMALKIGENYMHTFKFIAKVTPGAVTQGFRTGAEDEAVSEFGVKATTEYEQ